MIEILSETRGVDLEKDLIGIGAGPANLSLAAMLTPARERGLTSITGTFFEREARVFWHSLLLGVGQRFVLASTEGESD
jgi:lysine/ornithine N-monooxygenase